MQFGKEDKMFIGRVVVFLVFFHLVFFALANKAHCEEDYFQYVANNPGHKFVHFSLGVAGTVGLYGIMRSSFDDGQKWCVNLDDCRKITLIFGTLAGGVVEVAEMEDGEKPSFALHDILILNPLSMLVGIGLVDIFAPLGKDAVKVSLLPNSVDLTVKF